MSLDALVNLTLGTANMAKSAYDRKKARERVERERNLAYHKLATSNTGVPHAKNQRG